MLNWFALVLVAATVSTAVGSEATGTQKIVAEVASATLARFATNNLESNQLAITLVDLRNAKEPSYGSFRGEAPIYPASVIKLFYLVAAHRWMEDGKILDSEELRRAMQDMIVDSGNDPTHYVVDVLTGTTGGPELPSEEMEQWAEKRNAVNRFYRGLGYTNINVNQKPWGEGPYGRERVFVGKNFENRNALTTDATARLLTEIALEKAVTAFKNIKPTDAVIVGMYQQLGDQVGQNAGIVRELCAA